MLYLSPERLVSFYDRKHRYCDKTKDNFKRKVSIFKTLPRGNGNDRLILITDPKDSTTKGNSQNVCNLSRPVAQVTEQAKAAIVRKANDEGKQFEQTSGNTIVPMSTDIVKEVVVKTLKRKLSPFHNSSQTIGVRSKFSKQNLKNQDKGGSNTKGKKRKTQKRHSDIFS